MRKNNQCSYEACQPTINGTHQQFVILYEPIGNIPESTQSRTQWLVTTHKLLEPTQHELSALLTTHEIVEPANDLRFTEKKTECYFSRDTFSPTKMAYHLEFTGVHRLCVEGEPFVRVYQDGVYVPENGQILLAVRRALGINDFSIKHYNDTIALLLSLTTPLESCRYPGILNLRNGLLNLDTLELEPHTPDILSITQFPVDWDSHAECPQILRWLHNLFDNNTDQVEMLCEELGHVLLRTTELRGMFIRLEGTQTTKSAMLHLLTSLIGSGSLFAGKLMSLSGMANNFNKQCIATTENELLMNFNHQLTTDIELSGFLKKALSRVGCGNPKGHAKNGEEQTCLD